MQLISYSRHATKCVFSRNLATWEKISWAPELRYRAFLYFGH